MNNYEFLVNKITKLSSISNLKNAKCLAPHICFKANEKFENTFLPRNRTQTILYYSLHTGYKNISFLHHPRVITVVLTNFARKVKNTSVAMIEHKYVVNTIVHLYFSSSNHSYFQGVNISKTQL